MRFLHPELLALLGLLPLLALLFGRQGAGPALIFSSTAVASSLGTAGKRRPGTLYLLLRLGVLALLILALARPQLGSTTTEVKASGIDILLAVDVSGSMEAMDFNLDGHPTNRLEVVKRVMADFIKERPNDRIGLLAFGGKPYLVSPLTLDHDWLKRRLDSLRIGMVEDGTAIGTAIGSGTNRLRNRKAKSRILILLTDGISNAGSVPPLVAADAAKTLGIKVYTIGAGTRGEAPVPVVDSFGRKRLMRARVDIDERTLTEVATKTGATYFRATDTDSLEKIYSEINKMETTTRTLTTFVANRELFPLCIGLALFLLGFELYKSSRRLP